MILPFFLKELVSFEVKYSDFKILLFDFFLDSPEFLIFSGKFLFEILGFSYFTGFSPGIFFSVLTFLLRPPKIHIKDRYGREGGHPIGGRPGGTLVMGSYRQGI